MGYVNKKLLKRAQSMGRYIKLEGEGDSLKGIFLDAEEKYSEKYKKPTFNYSFEIEGEEKTLSCSSPKVAKKFAYIEPGTAVKVTRLGTGNKTDYSIEEIKGKKKKTKSLVSKKKTKKKKKKSLSL